MKILFSYRITGCRRKCVTELRLDRTRRFSFCISECVLLFLDGVTSFSVSVGKIREVFRNRGSILYKPRSSYGLFECRIIAYKDISPFVAY